MCVCVCVCVCVSFEFDLNLDFVAAVVEKKHIPIPHCICLKIL